MLQYKSIKELIEVAQAAKTSISEIVMQDQAQSLEKPMKEVYEEMRQRLQVMRQSIVEGMNNELPSPSGLSGGNATQFQRAMEDGKTLSGNMLGKMLARALAVSEYNACMGRIVAAPTAGSCGILPAVILTVMEERQMTEQQAVMGLITAGALGMVIANVATLSGAEGGCQAECGSATAMAAAAITEMAGGTPDMAANAFALALKNMLGLVCDPVAGLVEIPCVKRNAVSAAIALAAADMALADIKSAIPPDEVLMAMKSIGKQMSDTLKETAEGGLAATPTAAEITERLRKNH